MDGGRLALPFGGHCVPPVETCESRVLERRVMRMITLESIIALISLCITCFTLGFALGKSITKTQK